MTITQFLEESKIKFTRFDASRIGELCRQQADKQKIKFKRVPERDYLVNDYPKKFIPTMGEMCILYFTKPTDNG